MASPQNHTQETIAAVSPRRGASWANIVVGVQGPLVGLLLLCVVFSFSTNNAFLSLRNALNVLDQVTVLGILAIGMTAVIVSGGIDLSVGSVLAFSMMVTGWLSHDCGLPLVLALVLGIVEVDQLRKQGVSFIYISHRLEEIARIADRIVVLRDGRLVATHQSAQVPVHILLENMVGRSVDRIFAKIEEPTDKEVLGIDKLTGVNNVFRDVSFSVRAGEVFGIAGIVGAGRTELVRAIAGVDPVKSGSVAIDGKIVHFKGPSDAVKAGVVLVPEDRKAQGVVLDHTVAFNLALGNFDLVAPTGWLFPSKVTSFAESAIKRLGVKGQANQLARFLSGGNQQKAVIARWISRSPKVFILDEPTRGIDMGARAAIYETIADSLETVWLS
jgi:ABC-type multidrug transport system ATPase subunit